MKPTLTSVTQTNIRPETFPDILICPEEAFDLKLLNKLGFQYSFHYGSGYISNYKGVTGWLGNQTKLNVTQVADQISNIKSMEDCPKVTGRFKVNGRYETIHLQLTITRVLFHSGKCCRVVKPKEADNYTISYIYSVVKFAKFTNYTTGFHIFFSDQKSALVVQPQEFLMQGIPLKFSTNQPGLMKYKIKVLEEIHLEEDPNYPCRKYNHNGEYNQCLEEEYTRQSLEILNCTPPWMTDNQDFWCKQNINLSEAKGDKSWFLLGKLSNIKIRGLM